jgi:hypothetical protein
MTAMFRTIRRYTTAVAVVMASCAVCVVAMSGAEPQAPAAQRSIYQRYAPIDLTGTWVSVVTEDWAFRMIAPPKGDFANLPLTKAAQGAANRVDMKQVEATGRACDAYGAPVVMREPGRVRIAWEDATTLRINTDAGEQTRLLHFGGPVPPSGSPSRQGFSAAEWQYAGGFDPAHAADASPGDDGRGAGAGRGGFGRAPATVSAPAGGKLKVVTTNLAAGFLRKNGVPYSANTTVTEYYNLLTEPAGTRWFVVTTVVHDPENLAVDFITSTNFRQEPDDSKWRPRPCSLQ